MEYREYLPEESLRDVIRCYWMLRGNHSDESAAPEPALPDGSPELIFALADPFRAMAEDGSYIVQPMSMLVGQITRPLTVAPTGRIDLVAVRLEPAGASMLCDDMSQLTDRWTDIRDLSVRVLDDIPGVLARGSDDADRVRVLDQRFAQLLATSRSVDAEVAEAVQAIMTSHGMVVLEDLAARLGCSMRHLQRRFATQVGITPKLLARIRRFQRVFSAWREDPRSLSRVAAECGYFDQPHLIRDFRDFAGQAPAAFLANQPEFTQFFLPTNPQRP